MKKLLYLLALIPALCFGQGAPGFGSMYNAPFGGGGGGGAAAASAAAVACDSATPAWTFSSGVMMVCTLSTTNVAPVIATSGVTAGTVLIKVVQNTGTSRTLTMPSGNGTSTLKVMWPSGVAPVITAINAAEDMISCGVFTEFKWYCSWVGNFQ